MPCDNEDNALAALLPLLTSGDDNRFRDALGFCLTLPCFWSGRTIFGRLPMSAPSSVTAMPTASKTRVSRLV
jgi:hypothetical protein